MLDRKSDFARFAFVASAIASCKSASICLSHGIVAANQQIADHVAGIVAQGSDRDDCRKTRCRPCRCKSARTCPRCRARPCTRAPRILARWSCPVPHSAPCARACTSSASCMSLGLILLTTSAAGYPSMRSAPTLNSWMMPFSSVAMIEKLGASQNRVLQRAGLDQHLLTTRLGRGHLRAGRIGGHVSGSRSAHVRIPGSDGVVAGCVGTANLQPGPVRAHFAAWPRTASGLRVASSMAQPPASVRQHTLLASRSFQ